MTDTAYIETAEGWLYLAALLELRSRRVVGWACAPALHVRLVLVALRRALRQRQLAKGLMHPADRGVQYTCLTTPPHRLPSVVFAA
jgi:transposase InsO family protein